MKRETRRIRRATIALALVAGTGWVGCSETGPEDGGVLEPDTPSLQEPVVSDPLSDVAAATMHMTSLAAAATQDELVYVSLPAGTAPTGTTARIRRLGTPTEILTSIRDGGFDPVAVPVQIDDVVELVVRDAAGAQVLLSRIPVRSTRPPVVVRTYPPKKKTDVAPNSSIIIVFSEPINAATVTSSSIQLYRGQSSVAGAVRVLAGTGTSVAFTPNAPLRPNTPHQLLVTQAVMDLDGEALESRVVTSFTTGASPIGPAASITVSADSMFMTTLTYQLTAVVQDAAGNLLIDHPVTWSTDDPSGLQVSASGLVTAMAAGRYVVTARANGLTAHVIINVLAGDPASVAVAPTLAAVAAGDTIILVATVRDAEGRIIDARPVTWTSSDPSVATVVAAPPSAKLGIVTGVSQGSVTIGAAIGTVNGTAAVTVGAPQPVASVTVSPQSANVLAGMTVQLSATLKDVNGRVLLPRPVSWTSDNASVATVDATGRVMAIGAGTVSMTATSEGISGSAPIAVTVIQFASVRAGNNVTCGLTAIGTAYCWGENHWGNLGNGSTTSSNIPVPVSGGLTFTTVSSGAQHSCGLTPNGAAFCWGNGGLLGNGSTSSSLVPVAVTGGLTFATIAAGGVHTCGVTTSGAAYCWGGNGSGQLGIGSTNKSVGGSPLAVTGGLRFSAITAGDFHTCALASTGAAYCWGDNSNSQLGRGPPTTAANPVPVAVAGGLTFAAVTARVHSTCGLTTTGVAHCWGSNSHGQLGDGSTIARATPVAVNGGLTFSSVSAGGYHACGLSRDGVAYCWGASGGNNSGQLGNGSSSGSLIPVAVTGDLGFSAVTAGRHHTCGFTTSALAYCWGLGGHGQLGIGSWAGNTAVPVKVVGQP